MASSRSSRSSRLPKPYSHGGGPATAAGPPPCYPISLHKEKELMTIFKRNEEHVDARRWEGGPVQAMQLCKWMGGGSAYIPPTKEDPREFVTVPTPFGPRDIAPGMYVVRSGDGSFLNYKEEQLYSSYIPVEDSDHRLVKHAR